MPKVWNILTTRLWVRNAITESGEPSLAAFLRRFDRSKAGASTPGIKRDLAMAWRKGKSRVYRGPVERVAKVIGEKTRAVYVLATLLNPHYLSGPATERALCEWGCLTVGAHGNFRWTFPNDDALRREGRLKDAAWDDADALLARGDFYGFLGLLALYRRHVRSANSSYKTSQSQLQNVYRAAPAALRVPWVRPDADLVMQCLEGLTHLRKFTSIEVCIDWQAFQANVIAPDYEPNPRFWLVDPASGQYINKPREMIATGDDNLWQRPFPMFRDGKPLASFARAPEPPAKEQPQHHVPRPGLKRMGSILDRMIADAQGLPYSEVVPEADTDHE